MEQVLRKIYEEHYKGLQRKRLQKVLEGQHYEHIARKKYDFSDQIARKTRQTSFSYEEDIRFEKEFQSNQRHILQNLASIQAKYQKYNFPLLKQKQPQSSLKQKFKAAVKAIIFLNRLQRKLRGKMIRRKRRVQKMSENLVTLIEKMLRNYYEKILHEELINYIALLQKKLENPMVDQQKQTIQLLYYISEKLAHSSVIKELMDFFVYVATDKSFQPDDFLSSAEINRLDFSCMFGSIINVTQQQTRMIIGLGLGIKIFCFYILYQPWNLSFAEENFRQNCKQIKQVIQNTGSVFYYLIYEQFCLNLKEVRTITKSKVLNLGSKAMKQLNPFKEAEVSNTSKVLITGQTRFFLNDMELKYPHLLQGIKQNLFKWISRISYACLKESEKREKLKDQSSTFSSTISNKSREGGLTRNVFRSVELSRKRDQLINHNHDTRYNLPKIKRTIQ